MDTYHRARTHECGGKPFPLYIRIRLFDSMREPRGRLVCDGTAQLEAPAQKKKKERQIKQNKTDFYFNENRTKKLRFLCIIGETKAQNVKKKFWLKMLTAKCAGGIRVISIDKI